MTGELDVRLLGAVEVARDGRPAPLGGARQRRLLALLATDVGHVVAGDRIVDELWSGSPPPNADATLRTYVSRLRRALGADTVLSRGGGYLLDIDPEHIDARRFARLAAEGRRALQRDAPGAAADLLTAALQLWRGPAYGDVADSSTLQIDARRLDELRLDCLEQRVAAELALGRHDVLVAELQSLVREHPWRERLWQHLIVALYRSGRQADALAAYRLARERLETELGLDPSEELQELERDILRQRVANVVAPAARHNLPIATTRLIGREAEIGEVSSLVREHRLVVVTGIGGSGKTRLAVEVAHQQVTASSHGVWLVDLASVTDAALVPSVLASLLSVNETTRTPLAAVVEHLRRQEVLLVLDNCEHLVEVCADLVARVLRECANVRVLATSRVPLGVYGEVDYALGPLAAPATGADARAVGDSPAVQLFCDRAAAVRRDAVDEAAFAVVGEICRELDGLPLAIELAAARVKALSVHEVSARLDDRFRFLRAWERVVDPRHATLQTTMDWSYDLLDADEQRVLRRLAVFVGGAPFDAVATVCCDGDEGRALELLERLVDVSLLQIEAGPPMRYRMLETVRQYAVAMLAEDPDAATIRQRHARHFLRVAEQAHLALDLIGRGPQRADVAVREQHNLRAALDWCAESDVELALRLMVALENFWITHALHEGARRYDQLMTRVADPVDTRLRAQVERDRAGIADVLEQFDVARTGYTRSRELFAACHDEVGVAGLDFRLGLNAVLQDGDVERARAMWETSLATWTRAGDEVGMIQAITNLGSLECSNGDAARGRAMIREAIDRAKAIGWWWWAGMYSLRLAAADIEAGERVRAERLAREALRLALRADDRKTTVHALAVLARAAAVRGDSEQAADLWSAVESVEEAPGRFSRFDRAAYRAVIPPRAGRAPLPLEQAVELALS